ncbi:hypothetical protein AC579_10591 [Pseudocercospora musae]|uniref:Uncharacterized protein n=1 Tax=Pseudocercospora musae TaxID=113226 RepID=A0A139IL55_9PEZI|nr:hypothetical protein AC579_10591 [Pseudocercospora musae]
MAEPELLLAKATHKIAAQDMPGLEQTLQEWQDAAGLDDDSLRQINWVQHPLYTILKEAVKQDSPDAVGLLMTKFTDVQKLVASLSIQHDAPNTLSLIVARGFDVEEEITDQIPSLLAEATKSPRAFLWLLEHGADPMKKARRGKTVLDIVAQSASPEMVQQVLDYGGRPNECYALHAACRWRTSKRLEVIKMLVNEYGANNVNVLEFEHDPVNFELCRNSPLGTPLHYAARFGPADAVRLLLAKGADKNVLDSVGKTAMAWADRGYIRPRAENIALLRES